MATRTDKGKNKKRGFKQDAQVIDDPRFAHVHNDPRFIRPRRKDVKIKIDERFTRMLTAKNFADGREY
jgi:hypothetical protein